jgi:hypothetical protein
MVFDFSFVYEITTPTALTICIPSSLRYPLWEESSVNSTAAELSKLFDSSARTGDASSLPSSATIFGGGASASATASGVHQNLI